MSLVEVLHPSELSETDAAAWSALQAASPDFSSPLMGPGFARAVGEVRPDARVAVFRNHTGPSAFLAFHRRPGGFARPIGAPFSDYHALVARPAQGPAMAEVLDGAGLAAFRFSGLVDPSGAFAGAVSSTQAAYKVVLEGSPEDYLREVCAGSRNRAKNYRRYRGKLERDIGPLRLVVDAGGEAFDQLLDWKRVQIARTGITDFLAAPWTRALLGRLAGIRTGDFQGLTISLYAGKRHVCGHFGVRLGGHYHPWIGASDPAQRGYSPGFIHQWMAIEAMQALALTTYDLGPGEGHWKAMFASEQTEIGIGTATTASLAGRLASSSNALWRLPAAVGIHAAERLRRRMEQVALIETTLGGRLQGMVHAVAVSKRRAATRRPLLEVPPPLRRA
ncbi:MAG TPA: GNAT family N-acetyltransferase [Caulobacteraceae bacterium]